MRAIPEDSPLHSVTLTGAVTATKVPKPGCDVWNPSTQEAEIGGSEVQSSLATVNLRIAGWHYCLYSPRRL